MLGEPPKRSIPRTLFVAALLFGAGGTFPLAWGHGGGLDDRGCHRDASAGNYHCHQGEYAGETFLSKAAYGGEPKVAQETIAEHTAATTT